MVVCDNHYIRVQGIGIEFISLTDSQIYMSTIFGDPPMTKSNVIANILIWL